MIGHTTFLIGLQTGYLCCLTHKNKGGVVDDNELSLALRTHSFVHVVYIQYDYVEDENYNDVLSSLFGYPDSDNNFLRALIKKHVQRQVDYNF